MRIDPRYFNRFMVIVAATAAVVILYATYSYLQNREQAFRQQITSADSLGSAAFYHFFEKDSLRLHDFSGSYLVLDFWATWSKPALESHRQLAALRSEFSNTLRVVAASVGEDSSRIGQYRDTHNYSFEFVDGTSFFKRMNIPGIPSQVLIDPGGTVIGAFTGYTDSSRYDSLSRLMRDE